MSDLMSARKRQRVAAARLSFRTALVVVTRGLNGKPCPTAVNRKFPYAPQPTWTTPYDLYISC